MTRTRCMGEDCLEELWGPSEWSGYCVSCQRRERDETRDDLDVEEFDDDPLALGTQRC